MSSRGLAEAQIMHRTASLRETVTLDMDPFAKPPTISDDYRMADIYRQSADVFFEKGFERATMAEVAASVDLTQGGLYYYIKGKQVLLFAIKSYALDLLETKVLQPARRQEDPGSCLAMTIEGWVRLVYEEPSVMAMLTERDEHLERRHQAKIRSRKRLVTDFLCDVIASQLHGRGDAGNGADPRQAARVAIEMAQTARSWSRSARPCYQAMARRIVSQAFAGLSPELGVLAS